MLLRFTVLFGIIALLIVGGMALLAFMITQWFGGTSQIAAVVWVGGCGLALALPLLAAALVTRAARGITGPLTNVMAAADAVAEGDLSARLPERGNPEFRQLARSFNRMTEALEQADQQRRNLMADVAHELRTPLHIIQGNLEGVLDGVYEATPEHMEATLEETRLLARLVEDLRILSLAEAGHLPLRWQSVDVEELLADVVTSFSGRAQGSDVNLSLDTASTPPGLLIQGDAGRLDQVVGNLVDNALRHTPPGGRVDLGATATGEGVRITVSDTGEGIPAEELPHIFDRFWSRGQAGGGGLGLAIARSLVTAHGGTISVASQVGQGTTFSIDLPREQPGP